jgi:hypothetical protein
MMRKTLKTVASRTIADLKKAGLLSKLDGDLLLIRQ